MRHHIGCEAGHPRRICQSSSMTMACLDSLLSPLGWINHELVLLTKTKHLLRIFMEIFLSDGLIVSIVFLRNNGSGLI